MNKNMLYRSIPKVDVLLENEVIQALIAHYSRETVMESIHMEMDKLYLIRISKMGLKRGNQEGRYHLKCK